MKTRLPVCVSKPIIVAASILSCLPQLHAGWNGAGVSTGTGNLSLTDSGNWIGGITGDFTTIDAAGTYSFTLGGNQTLSAALNFASATILNTTSVTISNGGSGYTSNPTVTFTGGTGTALPAATANRTSNAVSSLTFTSPGSGYYSAGSFPTIGFTAGAGSGAAANFTGALPTGVENITIASDSTGVARILTLGGNLTPQNRSDSTLTFTSDVTVDLGNASRVINSNGGGVLDALTAITFNGAITSTDVGNQQLTVSNTGANTFNGSVSVDGGLSLTAGTNNFNAAVALGTSGISLSGGTTTISGKLSGSGAVNFTNSATLTLNNSSNDFTSAINQNGFGTVNFTSTGALGAGSAAVSLNNSTLAYTTGTASAVINRNVSQNANTGRINNSSAGGATSPLTIAGTVTLSGGSLNLGGTNTAALNEVTGAISGAANLVITNSTQWKISNTNSYSGTTTIDTGTLEIATIGNVGGGNSNLGAPTTIANGTIGLGGSGAATLRYVGAGSTTDRQLTITDSGSSNNVTLTANGAGALVLSSGISYTGTSQADKNRPLLLDGTSTGANTIGNIVFNYGRTSGANGNGSVTKNGAGLWVLTGTNAYNLSGGGTAGTYTTTVNAGTLRLGSAGAIPGGIATSGGTSFLAINGGVLELGASDFTRGLGTTATTVNLQNGGFSASGGNRAVNLGGASAGVTWGAGNFLTAGGAVFQLSSAVADSTIDFQNPINLGTTGTNTRTVQVNDGAAAVDAIISGVLGSTGGTQTLSKTGSGTLALTASNNYTGPTQVTAGTLEIRGSISASIGVSVSGGTLLLNGNSGEATSKLAPTTPVALNTGRIDLSNFSSTLAAPATVGALSLSGSSSIDFGSLGNTFKFADSHLQSWTGAMLSIYGWTPGTDHLFFGIDDSNGLTPTQLGQITFYGGAPLSPGSPLGTAAFLTGGSGELTLAAVPEPSTLALVAGMLGLIGFRERRRFRRKTIAEGC